MDRIEVGMLAWSRAGHDKGKLYMIVGVDDEYVYLADGKLRLLANPKKKKRIHLQAINRKQSLLADIDWANIKNEEIKRIIKVTGKEFNQEVVNVKNRCN